MYMYICIYVLHSLLSQAHTIYIYIYIYIYIRTKYIYIYIHTFVYVYEACFNCLHARTYIYIHTSTYTYVCHDYYIYTLIPRALSNTFSFLAGICEYETYFNCLHSRTSIYVRVSKALICMNALLLPCHSTRQRPPWIDYFYTYIQILAF